jgi:hypothetical protein
LERRSPVDARDESYDGTPLDWALYAWGNIPGERVDVSGYYEVVALLVRSGAKLNPSWFEGDDDRGRATKKIRSDKRMMSALADTFQSGKNAKK